MLVGVGIKSALFSYHIVFDLLIQHNVFDLLIQHKEQQLTRLQLRVDVVHLSC